MSKNEKRIKPIMTYLTENESKKFSAKVLESKLSQAEFIRKCIFKESFSRDNLTSFLIEKINKIEAGENELLKKLYVTQKLVSACLQELTRREFQNYKEMVSDFIKSAEEEAERLIKESE